MAFYVICGYEEFGTIRTVWIDNRLSKDLTLAEGKILMRVVPLDDEADVERRVRGLGLTTIPDIGPLLPEHFERFPGLQTLVPEGSSIDALNAAFEAATGTP